MTRPITATRQGCQLAQHRPTQLRSGAIHSDVWAVSGQPRVLVNVGDAAGLELQHVAHTQAAAVPGAWDCNTLLWRLLALPLLPRPDGAAPL
jgi:hypothetical protein